MTAVKKNDARLSPILTVSVAAELIDLPVNTLYSWLRKSPTRQQVIHGVVDTPRGWPALSVIGLAEAHTARALREHGWSMHQIARFTEQKRKLRAVSARHSSASYGRDRCIHRARRRAIAPLGFADTVLGFRPSVPSRTRSLGRQGDRLASPVPTGTRVGTRRNRSAVQRGAGVVQTQPRATVRGGWRAEGWRHHFGGRGQLPIKRRRGGPS